MCYLCFIQQVILIDRGHRHFYGDDFYEDKHPNFWRYDAYLFVYSITDSESMDNLCSWQDSVLIHRHPEEPLCLLVGNKCDLEDDREVSTQRARNMADNLDIESDNFFEISSKTGEGYDEVFNCLVQKVGSSSIEKGRGVSLSRSRFKINDRVSVRDKHGIVHHGTVSSTGVKKRIGQREMCVEIQMVIS